MAASSVAELACLSMLSAACLHMAKSALQASISTSPISRTYIKCPCPSCTALCSIASQQHCQLMMSMTHKCLFQGCTASYVTSITDQSLLGAYYFRHLVIVL